MKKIKVQADRTGIYEVARFDIFKEDDVNTTLYAELDEKMVKKITSEYGGIFLLK